MNTSLGFVYTGFKVPYIKVAASAEKKVEPDNYQTPPAASTEFSSHTNSPTSASFLDNSPSSVPGTVVSPRPVSSLSRTPLSFSSFLSNPSKEAKSQELLSTKKETTDVPQRKLIPCSPKLADRYKEKIETLGELQTVFNKRSPMKFNIPKHQTSTTADINQGKPTSFKLNASPKPDFLERRDPLKAVGSPYKAMKDTASTTIVTSTDTTVSNASPTSTQLSSTIPSMETQDKSIDFKEYRNYIENKIVYLERNLAAEKLAREQLEKEVGELKLIVTKLDKN